jgi:hypothetical protein
MNSLSEIYVLDVKWIILSSHKRKSLNIEEREKEHRNLKRNPPASG